MSGPHDGARIVRAGTEMSQARGALILLHGRGGSAQDILGLGSALGLENIALLAPQAAGNTWYPYSFLAPRDQNEPNLSSALETVGRAVGLANEAGIPVERIAIAGFSQGACLTTEFAARNPMRYAGIVAFTGGLIGEELEAEYPGNLAGTPALLSSGDPDPHVPWRRVEESAKILRGMGANVATHRHPGRPHTVTAEEVKLAAELLGAAFLA
ncbi:MAG TPA: dienelactone hydrolase family protein [Acidobacteriaceae bacterium]|jgi:predicted esterase